MRNRGERLEVVGAYSSVAPPDGNTMCMRTFPVALTPPSGSRDQDVAPPPRFAESRGLHLSTARRSWGGHPDLPGPASAFGMKGAMHCHC
jgi:hypothetical protein